MADQPTMYTQAHFPEEFGPGTTFHAYARTNDAARFEADLRVQYHLNEKAPKFPGASDMMAHSVEAGVQKALMTLGTQDSMIDLYNKMMDPEKRHQFAGEVNKEMTGMLEKFGIAVDGVDIATYGVPTREFDLINKSQQR